MKPVAAAGGVITSNSITNLCVLEGQRVSMTCKLTYNGTNLMPMVIKWYSLDEYDYDRTSYNGSSTVNMSSIGLHESSLTVSATADDTDRSYRCRATFSSPTGIVIRGVERQYDNKPYGPRSSYFYPYKRVGSEFLKKYLNDIRRNVLHFRRQCSNLYSSTFISP